MGYFVGLGMGCVWMLVVVNFHMTDTDIQKFTERCSKNDGVQQVRIDIYDPVVYCKDGAKFTVKGE